MIRTSYNKGKPTHASMRKLESLESKRKPKMPCISLFSLFDGNSIAVNASGELIAQLPGFQTAEQIRFPTRHESEIVVVLLAIIAGRV